MRIRATAAAAVVSGAVALTAAAIPAAQASSPAPAQQYRQLAQQARAGAAHTASGIRTFVAPVPAPLAVTFSNVKVNGGRTAVAGLTATVHVPYTFTLTATDVDVSSANFMTGVLLYRGPATNHYNELWGDNPATCVVTSSTTSPTSVVTTESCKGTIDIVPNVDLTNADAGAHWQADALALQSDSTGLTGYAEKDGFAAPTLRSLSRITVNASPKPVTKGKTVTIVGTLTRANWDTHKYVGYASQPVKLQFRKRGTSTYTTIKTIKTDSHGNLKTTYQASVDGYWRYSFAGTTTTAAVNAAGDYVHVR
jgi:hypothetical protein